MNRTAFFTAFALLLATKARAIAQVITLGATTWGPPKRNGQCPVCYFQNEPIKAPPCHATLTSGETVPAFCAPVSRACANCSVVFMQQPEV